MPPRVYSLFLLLFKPRIRACPWWDFRDRLIDPPHPPALKVDEEQGPCPYSQGQRICLRGKGMSTKLVIDINQTFSSLAPKLVLLSQESWELWVPVG